VNSWNVILATIIIFGAGVITGGLLVSHVDHVAHPLQAHHTPSPKPPGANNDQDDLPGPLRAQLLNKQFVDQLNDTLGLTPQQRQQIQKIITQGQQNMHDLWKLVGPQFQLVWRDTRQQIRQVLTPEQRKQFEALMKQQRQHSSTNAPPVHMVAPTNAPPAEPATSTNVPTV
jgi:Spy/CpxP family protein refolding chaperone